MGIIFGAIAELSPLDESFFSLIKIIWLGCGGPFRIQRCAFLDMRLINEFDGLKIRNPNHERPIQGSYDVG